MATVIAEASVEERTDPGLIQDKIRNELRRFVRNGPDGARWCCRL